ncbi:MAG: hypothetical protein JWM11_224 [Planctomycetaceae bacterium]|nr:hypothetical protein [Planctomycetaceae bacterium]
MERNRQNDDWQNDGIMDKTEEPVGLHPPLARVFASHFECDDGHMKRGSAKIDVGRIKLTRCVRIKGLKPCAVSLYVSATNEESGSRIFNVGGTINLCYCSQVTLPIDAAIRSRDQN